MNPIAQLAASGVTYAPNPIEFQGSSFIHQGANGASFNFELPKPIDGGAVQGAAGISQSTFSEPTSWGQMAHQMVMDVNQSQASAGAMIKDVLAGGNTPVHEAMVEVQEASVKFQMLATVRNKVLEAYQEVMRMQV